MNDETNCPHHSIVQFEQGDKITTQCTRCGKKMKVMEKPKPDTPRTDAVMASSNWPYHITSEMQKLERELNEVNKLNHQLLKAENDLLQSQDINSFLSGEYDIANARAKKAESEVERLKEQLESTKLLALKFWHVLEENGFKIELPNDSINTQNSINPDNK